MNAESTENTNPPQRGYARVSLSVRRIMLSNFLGGLAWGLGTVLGATVIVALVFFILNKLDTVPYIGDLINKIIEEVQRDQILQ